MGLIERLARLFGLLAAEPKAASDSPSSTSQRNYNATSADATSADGDSAAQPGVITTAFSGLDTEKFRPLTTDEALSETKSANWQTSYWDSLNTIPPSDLARIRVIDGTMVGLGLISEEELKEIHEIGRQMDRFKNQAEYLSNAGRSEVAKSQQQKIRLKERKKAESAARKQARQKAIAERHQTDIVFLGRGVSKGLADRRSNIEKLEADQLPVLSTPADLATALDISIPQLRWLAFHSEAPTLQHYVTFKVPKKSGGVRTLAAPHKRLAKVQRWILANVLRKIPIHDAAHGFAPGRSTATNAAPHVQSKIVVNADLRDFFPTIHFYRVEGLFRSFGYSPAIATIFALLTTECPRDDVQIGGERYYPASGPRALPQGACTSPALSNIVTRNLDLRLSGIARSLAWTYTRYADDLTFSLKEEQADKVGYLLARVRHICQDEGFEVNEKKTRVLRRNNRQSVTGIVVNDHLAVPRTTVRRVRAILHRAQETGLEAQNRDNHPNFYGWVVGMISYIAMVNPDQAAKLTKQLRAIK
jgi:RNA-directed DNA polymerase